MAIDVHAHHVPPALRRALARRRVAPRLVEGEGTTVVDCGDGLAYPLFEALVDPDRALAEATGLGIGHSLLSVPPPGASGLPAAEAASVARDCNYELAALAAASGGRLGGLALLPIEQPDAAAAELRRAAAIGLAGAQLLSNAGGRPLDGAEYRPLFEAAAELGLPLVLHPELPIDRTALGAHGLLTTLGFVFDTTVCASRLVLSGLFERHPDLTLVLPHAGATIPFLLGRFDYEGELMGRSELSTPPSEQLRMLHLDSIAASPAALRLAVAEHGAERILFGSDEPYWSAARGLAIVAEAGLGAEAEGLVLAGNASRLFGLPLPADR